MCIKYKDDIFHDVLQCLKILCFQKPQIPHMKDNRISFRYFTCTSPCLFAKNIVFPLLLCGPIIRFNTALPLNYPLIAQLCQLHTHVNTLTLAYLYHISLQNALQHLKAVKCGHSFRDKNYWRTACCLNSTKHCFPLNAPKRAQRITRWKTEKHYQNWTWIAHLEWFLGVHAFVCINELNHKFKLGLH